MYHKNIYETTAYQEHRSSMMYVEQERFFKEKNSYAIDEEYTLEVISYVDMQQKNPQYTIVKSQLEKCILKKSNEKVYEYYSVYQFPKVFTELIEHSNGHKYFPFHVDLYGISYLELDTLKVFNYIPEGYLIDSNDLYGESFIITDIHYDKNTDLIAYGGCYWGGASDVMVGDFSEPLHFNPHLVSIHEMIDPDYEKSDDIEFTFWQENALHVKLDSNSSEVISIEKLKQLFV